MQADPGQRGEPTARLVACTGSEPRQSPWWRRLPALRARIPGRWRGDAPEPGQGPSEPGPASEESLEALLRRVQWAISRPLAARLGGDERSLAYSFALELDDLRPYQPGDDVRHIDWKVTARSDRPFVRQSRAERALDVWLLVDLSASVDWGTARATRRVRAIELAALVGHLLGRGGHRIGALPFAARPLALLPPARGRAHLLRLLGRLRDAPRQDAAGRTDLVAALDMAGAVLRGRALVVVVSDFLVAPGWQQRLAQVACRHEVVAVRLVDPRDLALPDVGLVTFEDPETGAQMLVDTGDAQLRERFAVTAAAQQAQLQSDLRRLGVDDLVLRTDEEALPQVIAFLQRRRAGQRRGGARRGMARRGGAYGPAPLAAPGATAIAAAGTPTGMAPSAASRSNGRSNGAAVKSNGASRTR